MTDAGRALVQLRADLKVFVRNPAALFFTAILPVIFLTMFVSIFGNGRAGPEYGNVRISTLQVPAFIALAVVSASFVGLAMGLVSIREDGVLKRVRAHAGAALDRLRRPDRHRVRQHGHRHGDPLRDRRAAVRRDAADERRCRGCS